MTKFMKWILAGLLLALPVASSALEDTKPYTLHNGATTNATSESIDVSRYSSIGLDIAITNTATVTINARPSPNGSFRAHSCTNSGTGASTSAVTSSANLQCNVAGMAEVQAVISGCSSCTVTVRSRVSTAKLGGGGSGGATVQEGDGSPTVANVRTIIVTNGSLTDNGNGSVTVATSGASNVTIGSSTITGGSNGGILYSDAGPTLQQSVITGLVLGNGAAAPSAYGGVACTNQVIEDLSAAGAGTCRTITSAYVDSSILVSGGALGTPSSGTLTNATGLPVSTGISGLASGIATWLATPSSANLATAITNETGSGALVFGTAPTIDSPVFTTKTFIPRVTALPGGASAGDTVLVTDDSTTGACDSAAGSARTLCQYNGTSWVSIGDGASGGGSIGGSTGATDKAVLVANGTGGSTVQASTCTISAGVISCSGFISTAASTGTLTLLEGTAPGAGANPGEHNVYIDSADSKLKSQENGGSVVIYVRTADNLAVMAPTTSAQFAGVISDETGSGALVFGTSPTIATPSFSGSPTLADGAVWVFNPNGTSSGINVGSHTADPTVPSNGDIMYRSDTNKFRCRENGAWVDCINTGAGTGDITDVNAGAGISVATSGGPAPTVTWDPSTFTANVTLWSGASASRTLTASLTGATDPVITFGDNSVDVTTGVLKVAGSTVATSDNTVTFTNKSYDAEGTGNVFTIPRRVWLPAAGINAGTAASIWDLPASNPAVAAAVAGTNTIKGVLDFADASDLSAQVTYKLPSTWTGTVDANVKWLTTATTGNVVWQVQTICVADAETDDPAFNAASTVTDAAKGTTNQTNDAAITGVTVTGCAAGELMHVKIRRDAAHASDTLAATARLIGVELVIREAI